MKKIGILFGQENTFPQAFIDRINQKNVKGIIAEPVHLEEVTQGAPSGYAVIVDRISQDVPFYRAYLKNAALTGTAVINNPFWWSADEKFFNNALAIHAGVPVPKTVLLPSKGMPEDTSANSFRNLKFPLEWDSIFESLGGFPLYMKPYAGGGWKNVYKLHSKEEFFAAYNETGRLVMMLQETIDFTEYFRCYCIGGKNVRVMPYEPRNPHHLRYVVDGEPTDPKTLALVEKLVIRLNQALGYDLNTVEFAMRDGIPYAIDFCNPAPDAELTSVGEENFEWVVENMANYAIERAQQQDVSKGNLSWGDFMKDAVDGKAYKHKEKTSKAKPAGKKATKKTTKSKAKVASKTVAKTPAKKVAKAKTVEKKATKPVVKKATKTIKRITGTKVTKKINVVPERPMTKTEKAAAQRNLLSKLGKATAKDKDDLKIIKGVGPKLEGILNKLGIYTYQQVSKMTKPEYALVDALIDAFKGRGQRDNWAGQAKKLVKK